MDNLDGDTDLSDPSQVGSRPLKLAVDHQHLTQSKAEYEMAFEHAPVTKALMVFLALTSTAAGIFDIKHNLHVQLVPHLSRHYQYWRLLAHHIACASSSDLLFTELVLYNAAVHIERAFGTVKFSSFLLITLGLNTIATMLAMLILQPIPVLGPLSNHIPPGPNSVIFSIIYQYFRLVPEAYKFRIFGLTFSDKVWVYATASQLVFRQFPATLLTAIIGLVTGYVYRSDMMQLKGWRISHRVVSFGKRWIQPVLGEDSASRRSNRVLPEAPINTLLAALSQDEVVTTARTPGTQRSAGTRRPASATASQDPSPAATPPDNSNTTGVVRQWVSEIGRAARPNGSHVRVPNELEIQLLTSMFPDVRRDVILGVLQSSPNLEAATETLLSGSR